MGCPQTHFTPRLFVGALSISFKIPVGRAQQVHHCIVPTVYKQFVTGIGNGVGIV